MTNFHWFNKVYDFLITLQSLGNQMNKSNPKKMKTTNSVNEPWNRTRFKPTNT